MNIVEKHSMRRCVKAIVSLVICLSIIFTIVQPAYAAQCPIKFKGSVYTKFNDLTPSQWNSMIGPEWIDKGGHFLVRLRQEDRAADSEIYTPSDLESAMKNGRQEKADQPNRYIIRLTWRSNSRNQNPLIIYDYNLSKKKCEFVTFTWGET